MKQALIYSLKVWLTTYMMFCTLIDSWITCPDWLTYYNFSYKDCILSYYRHSYFNEVLDYLLVFLPLLVIYIFICLRTPITRAKRTCQIVSIIFIAALEALIIGRGRTIAVLTFRTGLLVTPYIIVNALSIWFYKLRPLNTNHLNKSLEV